MIELKSLNDIFLMHLNANDIEHDGALGSMVDKTVYEILPEEFLDFAENAIALNTKEGSINAVSNLKRALDCEMDMFFENINLKKYIEKNNLKFSTKASFFADIGMFPVQSINRLNIMRNKMEHNYIVPQIDDLLAYYELVWSIVKIIDLNIERFCTYREMEQTIFINNEEYYFQIKYDNKKCVFKFELFNPKIERKIFCLNVLDNKNFDEVKKAFNFYLISIEFHNTGNIDLYKKRIAELVV